MPITRANLIIFMISLSLNRNTNLIYVEPWKRILKMKWNILAISNSWNKILNKLIFNMDKTKSWMGTIIDSLCIDNRNKREPMVTQPIKTLSVPITNFIFIPFPNSHPTWASLGLDSATNDWLSAPLPKDNPTCKWFYIDAFWNPPVKFLSCDY